MERVRQALSLLFVMVAGACFVCWAGYFNDGLDFIDIGKHAHKFPMGPDKGPLAFGFGSLAIAWFVYPSADDHDRSSKKR